jgi:hypothetical protein
LSGGFLTALFPEPEAAPSRKEEANRPAWLLPAGICMAAVVVFCSVWLWRQHRSHRHRVGAESTAVMTALLAALDLFVDQLELPGEENAVEVAPVDRATMKEQLHAMMVSSSQVTFLKCIGEGYFGKVMQVGLARTPWMPCPVRCR